jgi:hypothetical protein
VLERGGLPLPHCIGYSFISLDYPFTFPIVEFHFKNFYFFQGLSLVLTVLFRFLAGAMIWLLLVALVLGSFGGTGYLW